MTHEYPKYQKGKIGSPQKDRYPTGTSSSHPADFTQGQTAMGSTQLRPQHQTMQPAAIERIPSMIQDPFDSGSLLDLTAAEVPVFNVCEGTRPISKDGWAHILYKGHLPNVFFYTPRYGKFARNPETNEPVFLITKKTHFEPDGSEKTVGGILSFAIDVTPTLPDNQTVQQWKELLRSLGYTPEGGGDFSFQPLERNWGKMDVLGLDNWVKPGDPLRGIDVGASGVIGFAYELTPEGADHFQRMVGASPSPFPPDVTININYKFRYMITQCVIKAHGFKKKTYDYFSVNVRARASYFGLFGGSFDYAKVRADLRSIDGFDCGVEGTPPPGVDLAKLIESIYDSFLKMEVGQWIEADSKPVQAPAPDGFFGGASVAMKQVNLSADAQFDRTINFQGVMEEPYSINFNFEMGIGGFDPAKHVFIERDDIKLPFDICIGNSEHVKTYIPSASYTTSTGPRNVQCPIINGKDGGITRGTIQYAWPDKPTSAQIRLVVDFDPSFGPGYTYTEQHQIDDTGTAFKFNPDVYVQRTDVNFVFAITTTDLTSKALFKWEWTPPPPETTGTPRLKFSGYSLISPDQSATPNNPPSYRIIFPFYPRDYKGDGAETPKIQYKVQGISGEWKNKTTSGEISLFEAGLAVDWTGTTSIGEGTLAIPASLIRHGIPDPSRNRRLASEYAQYITQLPGSSAGVSAGWQDIDRKFSLGYVPSREEPTLSEREMIATVNQQPKPMLAPPTYPRTYDLRNVNGMNFITPVRDQQHCGSCVAFGVCATVEGTLRVRRNDPYMNADFSEAHLFYCLGGKHGRTCGNLVGNPPQQEPNGGWWPSEALDEFQSTGVVDEACFPYASPAPLSPTLSCTVCQNWEGRTTKIDGWTVISVTDEMKAWISGGRGPLVACFTVYQDFLDYFRANNSPDAIYHQSANPGRLQGGHCICIVGYSDDDQCWICKNSWSPYWAASGFFKIGYGQVGIDSYMWGIDIS